MINLMWLIGGWPSGLTSKLKSRPPLISRGHPTICLRNRLKLFEQVRDKVLENTRRVPRYACVQTINRNQYRPQLRYAEAGRLRLDVAVLNGKETFAWAALFGFDMPVDKGHYVYRSHTTGEPRTSCR